MEFSESVSEIYYGQGEKCHAAIANLNALMDRLVAGERLSVESFRQEGCGYALRSGRVRLYGVFSKKHPGCFVLSHAVYKSKQKLDPQDEAHMAKCLKEFDALLKPPASKKPL
jgi:hypothetical protein